MAGTRIEIMEIKEILLLKKSKLSNRKIAEFMDIHKNTVNEYVRLFKSCGQDLDSLLKLDESELEEMFSSKDSVDRKRYEDLSSLK